MNKDYFHAIAEPEKYRAMQPMYQPELLIVEALSQTRDAWSEMSGALALWEELRMSRDNDVD